MFLWSKPRTLKTFGIVPKDAGTTKALAANQGFYNGFLSASSICGLLHPSVIFGFQIQLFFVTCVLIATL